MGTIQVRPGIHPKQLGVPPEEPDPVVDPCVVRDVALEPTIHYVSHQPKP